MARRAPNFFKEKIGGSDIRGKRGLFEGGEGNEKRYLG